ncbi:C10 family peptidase [uncultured Parabacteroides sp.]|uniref:C10 family peptidase n=1 Tax=uncultured Parabacteroides sp. TaxID=512312 RepID=UPI0025F8ECA1|nr:C10 family peptidase [uncultured Parabacteroides sp.]
MKKRKILSIYALFVILFSSCTDSNECLDEKQLLNDEINLLSQVEIKQMLDNMNHQGGVTKSVDDVLYLEMSSSKVECVDTVSQKIEEVIISQYKILDQEKEGYAVVLNDKRFPVVLAYVPEGNLSDTTKIAPLNMFFKGIPAIVNELYNQSVQTASPRFGGSYAYVLNEIKTKWHDSYPYNNKIPTSSTLHPDAGTHVSSLAQLCAYYKKGSYNWTTLLSSPTISPEETGRVELVSSLYLDVFNKTKTTFVAGKPTVALSDIVNYLHDLGFKSANNTSMRDFAKVKSQIYTDLKGGGLVLMTGTRYINNVKNGIDYWLVDGCNVPFDDNNNLDYNSSFYQLHCNWGQSGGLNSGYFLWLVNGNLLTTGTMGFDNNSYRSINAVLGIKK